MTQEEKGLLLKDLSARLPYRVIIDPVDCGKAILVGIKDGGLLLFDTIHNKEYDKPWDIEYIKPYLRPMSSMTKEEEEEYNNIDNRAYSCPKDYAHIPAKDRIDWLLKNHFDFRGLIPKGLAIEVTKENNPYEIRSRE